MCIVKQALPEAKCVQCETLSFGLILNDSVQDAWKYWYSSRTGININFVDWILVKSSN